MKPFTIEFQHKGKTRTCDLYAEDHDDAKAQIRSAHFNGEPYEVVFRSDGEWPGKIMRATLNVALLVMSAILLGRLISG